MGALTRPRRNAVSAAAEARGPPSINTVLPVGDVTSVASPWPTAMKSMRRSAASAELGHTIAAASSNSEAQRRNITPRYGPDGCEHKKTDGCHARSSVGAEARFPTSPLARGMPT